MLLIAEKINATIPATCKLIMARDRETLLDLARRQVEAGADYLDVNVGTGSGECEDEMAAMTWAVETIQSEFETPLVIDSADPRVLSAGLEARRGRAAIINSTKATAENLAAVVPLAARYDLPLVGLAMDEGGIPASAEARLAACRKIVEACAAQGVGEEKIYFDPLVVPVSTDINQGRVTLETLAAIGAHFPKAGTVMAVSNISFGLPQRKRLNAAFLQMAIAAGLSGGILDVLDRELVAAVKSAEVLIGRDKRCRKYTRFFRQNR